MGIILLFIKNVTIGVQDGYYPVLGERLVIYPNCVVIGKTTIGANSVIGTGTTLINKTVPSNTLVSMRNGVLSFRDNTNVEILKYFRI